MVKISEQKTIFILHEKCDDSLVDKLTSMIKCLWNSNLLFALFLQMYTMVFFQLILQKKLLIAKNVWIHISNIYLLAFVKGNGRFLAGKIATVAATSPVCHLAATELYFAKSRQDCDLTSLSSRGGSSIHFTLNSLPNIKL